jgi:hypothetical protein
MGFARITASELDVAVQGVTLASAIFALVRCVSLNLLPTQASMDKPRPKYTSSLHRISNFSVGRGSSCVRCTVSFPIRLTERIFA